MAEIDPTRVSATAHTPNTTQAEAATTRLIGLRDLAQKHLAEIDEMTRNERLEEEKRRVELDYEAKRKERRQRKQSSMAQDDGDGRKARMRTAQDVVDRLRWDSSLRIDEHRVGYMDRFGGIQELPVSQWIRESTDEEWIPQHRIRYFKRLRPDVAAAEGGKVEEDIVWHRDQRVDKVFRSQ